MKYARIINSIAVDTRDTSPENYFTPNIVAEFVTVPDQVEDGWSKATGDWIAPPPVIPAPPPPRQWTADDFRKAMTLTEKTKWDNDSAPEVVTVKAELPKDEAGAQELVEFLVASSVIAQATADKIME